MIPKKEKIASKKSPKVRSLIIEALEILDSVEVPMQDLTSRRLEKMAMCFLAVCFMEPSKGWPEAGSLSRDSILRTREIISYINKYFEEKISSGSYDDIRRKDLIRLVQMGLVVNSAKNPDADTNDGTRGYAVNDDFADVVRSFGSYKWDQSLASFEVDLDYIDKFHSVRELPKLSVEIADGVTVELDDGPHNQIQKAIVEQFLPIYGNEAKLLYIGDTSEKQMLKYASEMTDLGLDIQDRGMLPDIVAFSQKKEWLYLIEAVHSSNPLNPERCIELRRGVLRNCPFGIVFVTAFLSKKDFAKWMPQIAWETEVWIAESPEHMIHFNGDKFLGPHTSDPAV